MTSRRCMPSDLPRRVVVVRLSCVPWALAALWLVFAAWNNAGKDGGCFAGQPLWAFGQAAAALIGIAAAFAGTSPRLRHDWFSATGARRRWFAGAMLLFGIWMLVVFGVQPDTRQLAEAACR